MPSDVLSRCSAVSTRKEDPKLGFQRELEKKRAQEIADYIDSDFGTIPSSIILSAQSKADLKIIGSGKTLEFNDVPSAFLILDGQHRVYGFSLAKKAFRVPVVIYSGLSRIEETRLFIDINTKQKPVPAQLLLDIKKLADIESDDEVLLRDIFDAFNSEIDSSMGGLLSPAEASRSKITRVTFNQAVKPLLSVFPGRSAIEIYQIINSYLTAVSTQIVEKTSKPLLSKPVVFRAFLGAFKAVAQRLVDKFDNDYSAQNFSSIINPIFANLPIRKLENPGTSWTELRDYLETRMKNKLTL